MKTNVLQYLEESAKINSDKVVFSDENNSITYAELLNNARKIGTFLTEKYSVRNRPIFVIIDRNIESLVMFMGVVYSGNFYVPIDPELPKERLTAMFDTMQPEAIIGFDCNLELISDLGYRLDVYSDMLSSEIDNNILQGIRESAIDTDPLYAIFTSGSTGIPKAVLAAHRSVIDLADCFAETFDLSSNEIFGNQAPFDYDASVKDIYSTLKNGASCHIIPKQLFAFPVKLIAYINERQVNCAFWSTSVLCIIANLRAMKKSKPVYLKKVLFSGEVMPIKVLNYWKENLPDVMYVNLYGPTEITCNCTYYIVKRDYEIGEVLPIGMPFRNTNILVLNDANQQVKKNEMGELCVKGTSLALGYYNNAAKTQEVFCQNPLNEMYPERIYRTGDLVKYDENGELVYCARKDFQIKHMGHRIELGEIEVAVDALDFIARSCCLYDLKKEQIILIYQSEQENDKGILEGIQAKLPKFMQPSRYIWLEEMPLSKTGKIDRAKLKKEYIE